MGPRLRKTLKVSGWSFGSLLVLLVAFVGPLAYPGFMFAHQLEYQNITVHSEENLAGRIEPILARVNAQLAASEIHEPALAHDIFLGFGNDPFRILQGTRSTLAGYFTGMKPAPNYNASWPPHFSHVVSLDEPDVADDALLRPQWPGRFNMTHILTHEIAHSLIAHKMGLRETARLPMWKAEGYAEYVAATRLRANPAYTLRESVTRVMAAELGPFRDASGNFQPLRYDCVGKSYLKDEQGDSWHTCYYLARVLVEYSLDVKHLGFAQLAKPEIVEGEILREMLSDYADGRF